MKEEGDWSSEKRLHGRTRFDDLSILPEWASLLPELVQRIADCVLSTTGGVDTYIDMRAVCPSWRAAIAKPPPLAAFTDHRFCPRNWVMVDLKSKNQDDDARLLLHTTTGRFRRLRLPVLRDHFIIGASDGLIVLRDRERPRLACVLNPLTGEMLQFAAPLWENLGSASKLYAAVSGGARSTLVVWQKWDHRCHTVLYGDPSSAKFTHEYITNLTTTVAFQGNIYLAGFKGSVLKIVRPAEQSDHDIVVAAQMSTDVDIYLEGENRASSYLVESAGELLLVRHRDQTLKVFRVDVQHKLFEEVKSIGGCRALFLGNERSVSVDADKLPSVDGDCIYMFKCVQTYGFGRLVMHRYNLRDGMMESISNANYNPYEIFPEDLMDYSWRPDTSSKNPLSLIQVLLDYCNDLTF